MVKKEKNKLSKELVKRFSISYSKALSLGITDDDLKYIYEKSPTTFRVSVPNPHGKRKTKVEHELLDAIHTKYDFIKEIQEEDKEIEEKNRIMEASNGKLTKYNTVAEGIEVFLESRKKDFERGFIQLGTYEQDYIDIRKNRYIKNSSLINKKICEVNDDVAREFVNYLYDLKSKNDESLAMNTIYKPFSFVRKLFNFFKKDLKIIDNNPFSDIKNKPHMDATDKEYFTEEEMHYLHDKIESENIRFRTLIVLLLDSGVRREEALAIQFGDINRVRRTLTISRSFINSRLDGTKVVKPTKTKSSIREIALTNHCLNLIEKYKEFKEACGFVVTKNDFVFTAWDSLELVNPDRFTKEFKAFLKKIDINKNIPLKNLRTTNATFFVAKSQNLKAIQKHSGHSSFETTMTYYAQANLNEERKLANVYEEEFYNKLGLSVADLYRIVSDRFTDSKKIIKILEKVGNEYIDSSNYDIQLNRCKDYFRELFPIFDKILKIDKMLNDDELDAIFDGFTSLYLSIKIEPLPPRLKI